MTASLMQLAAAAGIESRYWDGLGVQRDLREPTAAALLDALDILRLDSADDAGRRMQAMHDEPFLAPLPPAVVLRAGNEPALTLALPQSRRDETLTWKIQLESGDKCGGEFVAARLQQIDERTIGGTRHARFRLPLPPDLAAGYHDFEIAAIPCKAKLIIGPARCFTLPALERGDRCWGFAVQLYALRSARNWGIGEFSDLAVLAAAAGQAGASFIGLNPMHARHLSKPDEASPYAPSSRLFLDALYINVEAVAGFGACAAAHAAIAAPEFQDQLARVRQSRLVDYAAVTALKLPLLDLLFTHFQRNANAAHTEEFRQFKLHGGEALRRFAEFEALRFHFRDVAGEPAQWRDWPDEYRDPASAALAQFRDESATRIEFQMYLQWLAATQLAVAAEAARAAGMPLGLYRDLAVGAAHDSAETWSEQTLFAHGVSVGAPPDLLNRQGQSWGLPPWKPQALLHEAYQPFRALLAANMRDAGALRIDHVMALTRLFWIPQGMSGADGGYVRNAFEDLLTIVALESMRNRCMVIGEDLGSVPDGLRARLREGGFLSYRVMVYERHWQGDGEFCRPHEYPAQSLATVATHDMPTMTEYWCGDDIARRAQLGMYPAEQQVNEERGRREGERAGMLRLLAELGLAPADPAQAAAVIEALHAAMARNGSMLAAVQLDDLLGETEPINIPGTYKEYPNWRRKLALPLEELVNDERWARLAALMRAAGRASPASPA